MRATASCIAIGILLTTTGADECPCGYSDANGIFTDIQETDFTTARDLIAVQNGWQIQEWSVPASPAANIPFGRSTSRTNVVSTDSGLDLVVRPERDGSVSGAELVMIRNDVRYGSFRVGLKIPGGPHVNGTCSSFFWYQNDAREIDIELLTRDLAPARGLANLVIHTPESQAFGYDASKTQNFAKQPLGFDPSAGFHEYRFDWLPDRVVFYVDSLPVTTMVHSVPSEAGRLFLNHWSNGSPAWSGGPPQQDATMSVLYVKAYFNSTDPERVRIADERCRAGGARKTCAIPDGISNAFVQLGPPEPAPTPTSGSVPLAHGATLLPEPGNVPFLSTNPENVVDQNTYNNTYRLPDGTETKQPNPGGRKKSWAGRLTVPWAFNHAFGSLWWLIATSILMEL